jgi:hypothetical protein
MASSQNMPSNAPSKEFFTNIKGLAAAKMATSPNETRYNDTRSPPRDARARSPPRDARARSPQRDARARSPQRDVRARSPPRDARARSPPRDFRARSPPRDNMRRDFVSDLRARNHQLNVRARSPQRDVRSRSPLRDNEQRDLRDVRGRSRSPVRGPDRVTTVVSLPKTLPKDIPLEKYCSQGLSCLHSKDPTKCPLNHLVKADGNMYLAGTRTDSIYLCEGDLLHQLGLALHGCVNLHCCEFPHAAGHAQTIGARVAEINEKSARAAAAEPRPVPPAPTPAPAASAPARRVRPSAVPPAAAPAPAPVPARPARPSAADVDIKDLEDNIQLLQLQIKRFPDNEDYKLDLQIAELTLAKAKKAAARS